MPKPESFVRRAEDVKAETWTDARGTLSFHALVSGDVTPSNGLVAGVSTLEPGCALALHSHEQAEVYLRSKARLS